MAARQRPRSAWAARSIARGWRRRRGPAAPKPEPDKANGSIETLHTAKETLDAEIAQALAQRLTRKAIRTGGDDHRREVEELLSLADPRHLTHPMVRTLEREKLSLRSGLSFTSIMLEQSEARGLGAFRPGWLLDNKARAYAFVDAIGVRRPASDRTILAFDDIERHSPIVIKPVRSTGSKGVYLVYSPERIVHVRDDVQLASWDEMAEHTNQLMTARRPLPDRWMVEELILEDIAEQRPAPNVKFYAFYGEVLLIQESRYDGGLRVRFWAPDGESVTTGRYEDKVLTDALGATAEEVKAMEAISEQIPVPFMRIDMLRGQDGLVFGEFTPRPGHFDQFAGSWDRLFAEAWVKAEGRIISDVLAGKSFDAFAASTASGR